MKFRFWLRVMRAARGRFDAISHNALQVDTPIFIGQHPQQTSDPSIDF
jgi:hypothetical protein